MLSHTSEKFLGQIKRQKCLKKSSIVPEKEPDGSSDSTSRKIAPRKYKESYDDLSHQ